MGLRRARSFRRSGVGLALYDLREVSVQGFAIERDDDHFAAVAVVSLLVLFRHVDDGKTEMRDVAILRMALGRSILFEWFTVPLV